jgi:hypothetical protein
MASVCSTEQGGDALAEILETISLDSSPRTLFEPTASNFYSESKSSNYASFKKAHSGSAAQLEARPNVYAAKLATNPMEQQNFFDIFTNFHDASIKITVDGNVQGSGTLFRSDTSLVIVTTAHIFEYLNEKSSIEIVLETGYNSQGQNVVQCRLITVPLKLSAIRITRNCAKDVAVLHVVDEETKNEVFKVVESFPKASFLDEGDDVLFMMIHYANGDHKQVTIGHRQNNYSYGTLIEQLHMDGGPGASGAPIYSLSGNVVAIQKAHVHNHQEIRSLILIEDVIDTEMYECGQSYVKEALVEADSNIYQYNPNMWVDGDQINPFEINEGAQSQRCLLEKIKAENNGETLEAEHLNRKGLPKISSPSTFDHIETNYPGQLAETVYKCLGRGGKHGQTKEWSLKGTVESDHFPPIDAYVRALNRPTCKKEVKAKINANRHRDNLPAITIPCDFHRDFDTTGSGKSNNDFREEQAESIGQGNFVDAIGKNLESYCNRGLFTRPTYPNFSDDCFRSLLRKYCVGFENALQEHVNLKFINPKEKKQLLATLRTVINQNLTN